MTTGIRIADLPDLGPVTDICKFVGDHSGSGVFFGSAFKTFVVTSAVALVATIAALRANTRADMTTVYVQGYSVRDDGGGGVFHYMPGDTTSADNGGTKFVDAAGHRWYREGSDVDLNILWFGGASVADFSPLLNAALAVVLADAPITTGRAITFPARQLTFNTTISFNYPAANRLFSLTLVGAGADATVLHFPSTNGLSFNMSKDNHSIHLRDMTIATSSSNSRDGLYIYETFNLGVLAESELVRVNFRGLDATAGTAGWARCCVVQGLSNYNIANCDFTGQVIAGTSTGIGVVCTGIASPEVISVIMNFTGCDFLFLAECVTYGDYIQGMTLSQTNMTSCSVGIHQPAGAGVTVIGAQLALNNCQFGTSVSAIFLEGAIGDVLINGTLFYANQANNVCLLFAVGSAVVRFAIIGNEMEGNGSAGSQGIVLNGADSQGTIQGNAMFGLITGISSNSAVSAVAITGNEISGLNATGTNGIVLGGAESYIGIVGNVFNTLALGVALQSGSNHCNVQSNTYKAVTTAVANSGTLNAIGSGSS